MKISDKFDKIITSKKKSDFLFKIWTYGGALPKQCDFSDQLQTLQ